MIHSEYAIARLRAYLNDTGLRKSQLAAMAGLRESALRNFDSEEWNPTRKILAKLEAVLPAAYVPKFIKDDDKKKNRT